MGPHLPHRSKHHANAPSPEPVQRPPKRGEFMIQPLSAILNTKVEPYCEVHVGTPEEPSTYQMQKTSIGGIKTHKPEWTDTLIFNVYSETETVRILVMDKNALTSSEEIAEVTINVGGDELEFEGTYELSCPRSKLGREKHRVAEHGTIKMKWGYNYSTLADWLIAEDDSELPTPPESPHRSHQIREIQTALTYLYRVAAVFFYLTDNFMWIKPFACAGQLLLVFALCFYTNNGIDALFPGLFALLMYYTGNRTNTTGPYWMQQESFDVTQYPKGTHPSRVPAGELRRTMPDLKYLVDNPTSVMYPTDGLRALKTAAVWCSYFVRVSDQIGDVLVWRKKEVATVVFRSAVVFTVLTFVFGFPLAYWKYGFFLLSCYLYIVFPLLYSMPKLRTQYGPDKVFDVGYAQLRRLKDRAFSSVKEHAEDTLHRPKVLPAISAHARKNYDEWRHIHDKREALRRRHRVSTPVEELLPSGGGGGGGVQAASASASASAPEPPLCVKVHVDRAEGPLADAAPAVPWFVKVLLTPGGDKFKCNPSKDKVWNAVHTLRAPAAAGGPDAMTLKVEVYESAPAVRKIAEGHLQPGLLRDGPARVALAAGGDVLLSLELLAADGASPYRRNAPAAAAPAAAAPTVPSAPSPSAPPSRPQDASSSGAAGHTSIPDEAVAMYREGKHEPLRACLRGILGVTSGAEDAEVLWWHARACYDHGTELDAAGGSHHHHHGHGHSAVKEAYEEGLASARRCKAAHPLVAGGWKFTAILLSVLGDVLGKKEKLNYAEEIKQNALQALEIDPQDAVTLSVVGRWYFSVADMPWALKQLAKSIFGAPLEGTYEEAESYLLRSVQQEPVLSALLALANTYVALGKKSEAKRYLQQGLAMPAGGAKDRRCQKDMQDLLKKC
eukprot:Rhum_TRINITY_DN11197_c2_g1::Rhum_TRINITY_DN11197_c2_g1_i1::g.42536::m.42536